MQINELLLPLKSPEKHRFSDDFRGIRSLLILLNSLNIRSEIGNDPYTELFLKVIELCMKSKDDYASTSGRHYELSFLCYSQIKKWRNREDKTQYSN